MIRKPLGGALIAWAVAGLAVGPAHALLEDNLSSLSEEQTVGYLTPLASGLSGSLNSGIFRSGSVPSAGFSLTLDLKGAYMSFSDDDRVFSTPTSGGFESVEAPTVVGDTKAVAADHGTVLGLQFTYPGGLDMEHFGLPVPQLTVGNFAGTRAMIRYLPPLSLGDEDIGDLKFFGIGAQHSVSQYLPGIPVDLAFGVMWQSLKLGDGIVDATALALNVTGSKRFGAVVSIEPYVGVGMDSFEMSAEYDSGDETIKADFDRQNDGHLSIGTGVNFPGVKLHAEYSVAAVNGFAGGISFGI